MIKVKRPKLGEYVFLAKWADKDLLDPWRIGFLYGIQETEDGFSYQVRDNRRWFSHCWRITPTESQTLFNSLPMIGMVKTK